MNFDPGEGADQVPVANEGGDRIACRLRRRCGADHTVGAQQQCRKVALHGGRLHVVGAREPASAPGGQVCGMRFSVPSMQRKRDGASGSDGLISRKLISLLSSSLAITLRL